MATEMKQPLLCQPDSTPRSIPILVAQEAPLRHHQEPMTPPGKPEAEAHALKQELRSLLIWTPLGKTEFHSEAFTQIVKNLFLGGTTLVHHNP